MNWLNINSMEELQSLGNFRDVSKVVKEEVGTMGKINGRGWQSLYDSILFFRESVNKFTQVLKEYNEDPDEYFTSKANEYIFYLLELEGELKENKLGITKRHYTNKRVAKQWMVSVLEEINPKVCRNSHATEAVEELNKIYEGLIGSGRKRKKEDIIE